MGAMLTGNMICSEVEAGRIQISDFCYDQLNPNSYNIKIGDSIVVYEDVSVIDLKDPDSYKDTAKIKIPDTGFILRPGFLYLIPTGEKIETDYYIPLITGRSSIGRLGIAVHQEAGFGDIGYSGIWTLQMKVSYPTRIYPNIPMAQVYFLTPHGPISDLYCGKYNRSTDAAPSKWEM